MGLFGKLFDKKECAICGGEIGLLGNRKLEDGNMCKHCAAKLSPWFEDRKHSTVQEIEAQLRYREENQAKLNGFRVTRRIGEYCKMFVEEVNSVPMRFVVCRSEDYCEVNADIIAFKDVSSCKIDIREHRRELEYTNGKNERVKYDPPRYEYQYDFCVELGIINNPYFDEISFKLNNDSVDINPHENSLKIGNFDLGKFITNTRDSDDLNSYPEYRRYKEMCDEIVKIVEAGQQGKPNVKIEDAILGVLSQLAVQNAAPAPQATPAQEVPRPKFCSNCGAPAEGGKFCQNCGSPL
ncbi:MAG: DUF4428 domain-containing protein [Clostridia bacterium]|nr:DUF4428 domain-containing protein [Clostridia bacterium]